MSWYRWAGNELLIDVAVHPGAKRNEILGLHDERLKVRIQSPPVDGRANAELTAFISDCLGVPKRCVQVQHGAGSRHKQLRISSVVQIPVVFMKLGMRPA